MNQEEQGAGTPDTGRTHGKHILSTGSHVGNCRECLENQQHEVCNKQGRETAQVGMLIM